MSLVKYRSHLSSNSRRVPIGQLAGINSISAFTGKPMKRSPSPVNFNERSNVPSVIYAAPDNTLEISPLSIPTTVSSLSSHRRRSASPSSDWSGHTRVMSSPSASPSASVSRSRSRSSRSRHSKKRSRTSRASSAWSGRTHARASPSASVSRSRSRSSRSRHSKKRSRTSRASSAWSGRTHARASPSASASASSSKRRRRRRRRHE